MKNSFTLIEVVTYLAVLSVIVVAVSSFFLWATKSNTKIMAMRETLDNSQRAMDMMIHEIKEAKSIYTPTTTPSQLSLETSHYLPEGEKLTYLDFYICEDRLCLKKESENAIALTSERVKIISLVFTPVATNPSYPSVQIYLKVDYNAPAARPEYQATVELTSTASLRSY